jgi:hypothetical protein
MRAKPNSASAEGGNRTLIPVGNTILSRARLPVPPLRLSNLRSQVYHSQYEGQVKFRSARSFAYLALLQKEEIKFRGADW